ncbi:MAG: xanthine dehydrogenase [Alphaproteobacteria bacterium]|nr:xanthine dehydrogenase [Alphaproteobacteria bacterium]
MRQDLLQRVLADVAAKRPAVVVTHLTTGAQALVHGDGGAQGDPLPAAALAAAREALAADQSRTVDTPEGPLFLHVFSPPLRLVIVGAVHIAQPLAHMAALAGYAVSVVDPRRSFATKDRFPGVALSTEWPDEAMARIAPDARTVVITLTHDPKLDDPALAAALRSGAFYIGALGSRQTHARRLERLGALGFATTDLARIHGPVGLDIGAVSPAEIAVSILAQVTERRRRGAPA